MRIDFEAIKQRADCVEVAQAIGLEVRNNRCAAVWRGGDSPTSVSLSREAWCDHAAKNGWPAGGSAIDLVALQRFGWDGQVRKGQTLQDAAEWLGEHYKIASAKTNDKRREYRRPAPVAKGTGTATAPPAAATRATPTPAQEETTQGLAAAPKAAGGAMPPPAQEKATARTAMPSADTADTPTLAPNATPASSATAGLESGTPAQQPRPERFKPRRMIPKDWPKGEALTPETRAAYFERKRGWNPGTLKESGAAIHGDIIAWPMRDKADKITGWKLRIFDGSPFENKNGETLKSATSSKPDAWRKGGKNGLLGPDPTPDGPLIVCEGEADMCAAISAGCKNVVALPGAQPGKPTLAALKTICESHDVILAPDGDEAGERWLASCAEALQGDGENPGAARILIIRHGCKDLDDCLKAADDPAARLAELMASAEALSGDELEALVSEPRILSVTKPAKKKKCPKIAIPEHMAGLPLLNVPSTPRPDVTVSSIAAKAFSVMGKARDLFTRGRVATEVTVSGEGVALAELKPEALCSRLERRFRIVRSKHDESGNLVEEPAVLSKDLAGRLLATIEAREQLPPIAGLSACPMLARDGRIIGPGYDGETGWLVTGGIMPPELDWREAAQALEGLLCDFNFPTQGDKARALAAFLTPCMKLNGHIGSAPADIGEADDSQSGKTYRLKLVAAIYGESLSIVTNRQSGGVGSLEESLNAALIRGRPFILLDNLRGKLDSQYLEAFMTADSTFSARIPYSAEVEINPRRFHICATSNGFEATRDFANRCAIVRIRKNPGDYRFKTWPEGDLLAHVKANQAHYLGAVFAIVREWIRRGQPRTDTAGHDFREWAQTLDAITQNLFNAGPLLAGHDEAKATASNETLGFLRQLAFALSRQGRLGESLQAKDIYELTQEEGIQIPGLRSEQETVALQCLGRRLAPAFKHGDIVIVEGFRIMREIHVDWDSSGKEVKRYTFERLGEATLEQGTAGDPNGAMAAADASPPGRRVGQVGDIDNLPF